MAISFNFKIKSKAQKLKDQAEQALVETYFDSNPELKKKIGAEAAKYVDPKTIALLAQAQQANRDASFYNGQVSPQQTVIPPAPQVQPLTGNAQQAFDSYKSNREPFNILNSLPSNTPKDLKQKAAEADISVQKEVVSQTAKDKAKLEVTKGETLANQSLFMKRLGESYNEVTGSGFKAATDVGVEGSLTRAVGRFAAESGIALPKTGAFLKDIKVLANQQARNVEGGRVTDQDRQIYAEAMANVLTAPSEGNVVRAANAVIRLNNKYDGGVPKLIADIGSGDNPLTDNIFKEVMRLLSPDQREQVRKIIKNGKR